HRDFVREVLSFVLGEVEAECAAFIRLREDREIEIAASLDRERQAVDVPISFGVVRNVTSKGVALLSADVTADPRFESDPSARSIAPTMRSVSCAPVVRQGEVLGAIYIARGSPSFSDVEHDLITAIGYLAGSNLEHAIERERALEESFSRAMLARF